MVIAVGLFNMAKTSVLYLLINLLWKKRHWKFSLNVSDSLSRLGLGLHCLGLGSVSGPQCLGLGLVLGPQCLGLGSVSGPHCLGLGSVSRKKSRLHHCQNAIRLYTSSCHAHPPPQSLRISWYAHNLCKSIDSIAYICIECYFRLKSCNMN